MTSQLKAELLKIRSTRTTVGLVLGMVVLIVIFGLLTGLATKEHDLVTTTDQLNALGVGSFAGVFAALAGIMLVTSEYRYGTIQPTFLFSPRRREVLVAKLAAGALAGLVFGIVGALLSMAIGYACLAGRGIDYVLSGGQTVQLLLGSIAVTGLWGAIGVGLGAVLRNQVSAIIGLLAWGFVVENLVFGLVSGVGRFGPVHAGDALLGPLDVHLLGAAPGALVLLAWAAAVAVAGTAVARRRDIA